MRILFLDIEATDLSADIGNLLSIGYKFSDEKKAHVMDISQHPGKKLNDDSALLEAFRPIYEQADLIVHHFGDYYDVPFLQTRCIINGLRPLPTVTTVDTWRIARKKMKFGSNRLQRILEVLGCPYDKTPVKLSVWADARVGDRKALKYIVKHNYYDVLVLEWVYYKIRALWPSHPVLVPEAKAENRCPLDGAPTKSKGRRLCGVHVYQRRVCGRCGHTFKGRKLI